MKYFCGWDGGGSKTAVLCADEHGNKIARETFGTLNLNGALKEEVSATISNAVNFMKSIADLNDFAAVAIGAAGVSNAHVRTFIDNEVRRCGYTGKLMIAGDHEIALEGLLSGPGAVLIAGTGSVCIGKDSCGNRVHAGGFGHLIDDCGSGYAIGRDILSTVVRSHDGRGHKTVLTEMVLNQLHLSGVPEIATWLYNAQTEKKDVAMLAPLLNRALEIHDAAANQIAANAACELAQMAIAVFKNLNLDQGELALTGSILEHFSSIRQEVLRLILDFNPKIAAISSNKTACDGALQLAMKMDES